MFGSSANSKPIQAIPDYQTAQSKLTEQKLGLFNYSEADNMGAIIVQDDLSSEKGPCELVYGSNPATSKAVYVGQWNKTRQQREGKGYQVWPDGTKFEGLWFRDKAHGTGRVIYPNGDYFQGTWQHD